MILGCGFVVGLFFDTVWFVVLVVIGVLVGLGVCRDF